MADFALDVSARSNPHTSYARVTELILTAAEAEGLAVERWEGGACASEVLWVPQPRLPDCSAERLIVTCHDVNPLLPDGRPAWQRWWRGRHYGKLVRTAARRAWRFSAPSQDACERIEEQFPEVRGRVKVVPWFLGGEYVAAPRADDAERRARLGLGDGYVLYLGAFRRHKNWSMALRAYGGLTPQLRARHELVLVGRRQRAEAQVKGLLTQRGLSQQVRLLEGLDGADLPALYRGASAFLFPSRLEGFGLPPLEAQACGVPVLAANTTSLPEVAGQAARLDPDDARAWIQALEELLADPASASAQRQAGLDNAARYSAARTGAAIRALLAP